ncbi:MAG: hypothetical protein J5819_05865 [Eubacterium sp.]|nr:hypothetical protein [Eubacterium sp.]
MVNQNFYLLTLAVIAREFDKRGISEGEVILATGLPIGRLGSEKATFREYLMQKDKVTFCDLTNFN